MSLLTSFIIGVVVAFLFWAPTCVAMIRQHPNAVPIFLVNFLLGGTGLGWIGALVWSFLIVEKPKRAPGMLLMVVLLLMVPSIIFSCELSSLFWRFSK